MDTEELIEQIFHKKQFFESMVLNVKSDDDKDEIMHILSQKLVQNTLKEHLNFVYIEKLSDFTLRHIVNILFRELANEWVSYAIEILQMSKDDAIEELQFGDRIKFVHDLADSYYKNYADYIYEDIADSFISLLASMGPTSSKIPLVNAVINSDLIANRSVLGINSFDQLYRRVKAAKNAKSLELSKVQMKLSDMLTEVDSEGITKEKKEDLLIVIPKYQRKNQMIIEKELAHFDASLQRVKMAIFNSLSSGIYKVK